MKKMIFLGLVSAFVDIRAMDESIAGQSQHSGASECPGQSRVFPQCTAMSETKPTGFKPQIFRGERSSIIFENSSSDHCGCEAKTVSSEFVWRPERSPVRITPKDIFKLGKYDQSQSQISTTILSMPEALQRMFLKSVDIPDNVEEICEDCFRSCESLSSVTFGEGSHLKLIGKSAFMFSGLREIQIPDNVEEICEDCFRSCESLSSVTFGEGSHLKLIGKSAFMSSGLREIQIPDAVEEIGASCFSECENLVAVRFGEHSSLCKIGKRAFAHCFNLEELNLPDRVESIPDECFFECNQLDITFGHQSRLRNIGDAAFAEEPDEHLKDLRAIYIPDGVEELGSECFLYSSHVSIIFGKSSALKFAGSNWCLTGANVVYPQKLCDVIRAHLYSRFDWWEMPTFQTIEPINKIQVVFIYYDSDDQERTILLNLEDETILSLYDLDQETAMQVVEVIIPPNTKILDYGCFSKCVNLRKITFADGSQLKLIRSGAFGGTKLIEITIPDSVEELGNGSFCMCNNLSVVRFAGDSKLKTIGACAFSHTTINTINIPDSVEVIDVQAFSDCQNLSSITFGESSELKSIGWQAFMKSGLRGIQIPDSVEKICGGCFAVCRNLSCITFGEASNLQRIGQKVFDNSGLTKVCAPKNVQDLIRQVLVGTKLDGKVTFSDPQ